VVGKAVGNGVGEGGGVEPGFTQRGDVQVLVEHSASEEHVSPT
jgi:hypothetical protein